MHSEISDRDFMAGIAAVTDFAWSAPMRDLAARVGISDVGLKKLLHAQGIVTPPQGHWNRVKAGRRVPAPPKPAPRGPGSSGRMRLDARFRGHVPEAPEWPTFGPFVSAAVPEDLDELRAIELKAIGRVRAPRDLTRPAAGLADLLRREEDLRRKAAADRFRWRKPHFDGPLPQRQLRILSALFGALAQRGHLARAYERNDELHAAATVGDTYLGLAFSIVGKHQTEMRGGYWRPASDLPASTPLRLGLVRMAPGEVTPGWEDGPAGRLESRLAEIAAELIVLGEARFREGLIERARWREQEREHKAAERRRYLEKLADKRVEDLKTSGALLRQAGELRALVVEVRSAVGGGSIAAAPEQLARWERWALEQADRLDPVLSGQVLSHLSVPELDDLDASAPGG